MTKKCLLSDDEREAFRQAVDGITPIKQTKLPGYKPKIKSPANIHRQQEAQAQLKDSLCSFADDESIAKVHSDQSLFFARPGLQHKAIKALRQGETPVQAFLDLHGLSAEQAHETLHRFLVRANKQEWRCLHIIHGKGGRNPENVPILKNKVNQWLRKYPEVLAFCTATPRDGGMGAVYVLLRRN